MKFNLNKNDGNQSRFDLSKEDSVTHLKPISDNLIKRKKNKFLWIIPLLLIIGGGIWYGASNSINDTTDTNQSNAESEINNDSLEPLASSEDVVSADNTISKSQTTNESVEDDISVINNTTPVNFAKGSISFFAIDSILVEKITNYLKANPNAKITVNGYASSEGPLKINQEISQKRANVFKGLLISKGINSVNIEAYGKGISDPIAPNETEEGRQKNRRVEVLIQ